MKNDRIKTSVLSVQVIPNADGALRASLGAGSGYRSLGIITTDCDDVSYAALDEATKKADVGVLYAKSMYAGAANASTELAGEFIGILGANSPDSVKSGLDAAISFINGDAAFYSANDDDSIVYFAHCISRTGSYLSKMAGAEEGCAMAYLIAPPQEGICGLDSALKAAQVEMKVFYGPPTETNFCGGLLVGSQSACKAACDAFAERVCEVAADPLFAAANGVIGAAAPHTGTEKPEHMTNLFGNELVRKNHPRIRLRGRLDSLEAEMLEVQLLAAESGNTRLAEDIGELYGFVQAVLACEVTGRPLAPVSLLGLDSDGLRRKSHNIIRNGELRFNVPDIGKGKLAVALNALRAKVREVEIDAVDAFCSGGECDRIDIIEGLNRLSSAVYILYCREAG